MSFDAMMPNIDIDQSNTLSLGEADLTEVKLEAVNDDDYVQSLNLSGNFTSEKDLDSLHFSNNSVIVKSEKEEENDRGVVNKKVKAGRKRKKRGVSKSASTDGLKLKSCRQRPSENGAKTRHEYADGARDGQSWDQSVESTSGLYACTECSRMFDDYSLLQYHMVTHYTSQSPEWSNDFKASEELANQDYSSTPHNNFSTTGTTPFHYSQSPTQPVLDKTITLTKFQCSSCPQFFYQEYDLQRHVRIHRSKKMFICSVCSKVFSCSSNLYKHMASHTNDKPFKCSICPKAFPRQANLVVHQRVHTGEKPYDCTVCGRMFSVKSQVNKHMRIHTGERPFKCSICPKAFNSSSDLRKHTRIHTGEKPFECSLCEKKCSTKVNLETHMRFHTGQKPYPCDTCGKCFMVSSQLIQHRRKHTGERPYKCDICEMTFASSSDRKRHSRTHSGEKPYKCSICDKMFAHSTTMRRHFKNHSKDKDKVIIDQQQSVQQV